MGAMKAMKIPTIWCGCHLLHLCTKSATSIEPMVQLVSVMKDMSTFFNKSPLAYGKLVNIGQVVGHH